MLLFLLAALPTFTLHSQQTSISEFIEKYRNEKGFSHALLSQELYDVTAKSFNDDKGWKQLQQVMKNIGMLTVLSAENHSNAPGLYKEALRAVPQNEFEEIISVKDGANRVRIWTGENDGALTDLVLLAGTAEDFVLVAFNGSLELNNITQLIGMMGAETTADLARSSQMVAAEFSINPNPNNGEFRLDFVQKDDAPSQLTILDPNGRLISSLALSDAPTQQVSIKGLPVGNYLVQVKSQKGKIGVKKLQIVK